MNIFRTGKLLMTRVTSKWSDEEKKIGDYEEKRRVFFGYWGKEGVNRQYFTTCDTYEKARIISICLSAIYEYSEKKEQAIPKIIEASKELRKELNR